MKVDTYNMKIDDGKDELRKKSETQNALPVVESIRIDIAKMWLKNSKASQIEFA